MSITILDLYEGEDTRLKVAASVFSPTSTQPIMWELRRGQHFDTYGAGVSFTPNALYSNTHSFFNVLWNVGVDPATTFGLVSGGVFTPYSGTVWFVHGQSGLSAAANAPTLPPVNTPPFNFFLLELINRFGAVPANTDYNDSLVADVALSMMGIGHLPVNSPAREYYS